MEKKKLKKKIEKLTKKNRLLQLQMLLMKTGNNSLQTIIISEDEKEKQFGDKYLASKMMQRNPVDKPFYFCTICDYSKNKQKETQRNKGYDF